MDTTAFDTLTRFVTTNATSTRRSTFQWLIAGAAAVSGAGVLQANETAARKKKKKKDKKVKDETPPASPPENVCEGKNWCVDRSQTCGPSAGYGKCLVESTGDNLCAEILFQVKTCDECAAPNCTNCRCVLAAGGGDRCNNGAAGYDFICVREVQGA